MNTIVEGRREIPVQGEYDVSVCGGGLEGTAAAAAAAVTARAGVAPRQAEIEAVQAELGRQGVEL